jgi:hypothetical protein
MIYRLVVAASIALLTACSGNVAQSQVRYTLQPLSENCQLPSHFQNQALIDRAASVSLGSTVDTAIQQMGQPTQPISHYRNIQAVSATWQAQESGTQFEVGFDFMDGKTLSDRTVTLAYNLGTPSEKLCTWKIQ